MIANNIKTDRKKDILLATEKTILLIKQGRDSIFVTADTLYSARLSDLMKTRKVPVIRDSGKVVIDTTKSDSSNGPLKSRKAPVSREPRTKQIDTTKSDSSNNKFYEAF